MTSDNLKLDRDLSPTCKCQLRLSGHLARFSDVYLASRIDPVEDNPEWSPSKNSTQDPRDSRIRYVDRSLDELGWEVRIHGRL